MSIRDLTIFGTSSQQPTRYRNHGAYLIRWNEEGLLFDPGEGTQRQFIFANIAPPCVNRIFISHFHGDHCLGLGSMLMRLNLDKVQHPIHCYYPASGKKYFDRLRYGTLYHEMINVIEHPVEEDGIVEETSKFTIEARFLEHGVDNIGWRIREKDRLKFDKEKLKNYGIQGRDVRKLQEEGSFLVQGREVQLKEVSWIRKGDTIAYVVDTRLCENAFALAKGAKLLICESTYLQDREELAIKHKHLTAKQAASIAKKSNAELLVLTHFSARYLQSEEFAVEAREVFPNVIAAQDLQNIPF
jgi:ribonuclease Z